MVSVKSLLYLMPKKLDKLDHKYTGNEKLALKLDVPMLNDMLAMRTH